MEKQIGRIEEGRWADIVVFDPETVADNTTTSQPYNPPTGIKVVLVSGKVVVQDGQLVNQQCCGRLLRR
jgi:N-acyl-D-amino-acid deacylase